MMKIKIKLLIFIIVMFLLISVLLGVASRGSMTFILFFVLAVLFIGNYFVFMYYVGSPLEKLTESVNTFKKGKLKHKVDIKNKDEIGELAHCFNKMAFNLHDLDVKSEKFYKAIEGTNDAVFFSDVGGNFSYVNPSGEKLFGYKRKELEGKSARSLHVNPDLAGEISSIIGEKGKFEGEFLAKRLDGTEFPAWLSSNAVKDRAGKIITVISIVRDLSDYKKTDKARRMIFLNTTHELKTPVTPIKAQATMLKNGKLGKLTPEQKASITIISRNITRLDELISNILEISRIQAGVIEIKKTTQDLRKIINRTVKNFRPLAMKKKIKLISAVPEIIVSCDAARIEQVLTNLLDNAFKFTKKGSITIKAEMKDDIVVVSLKDTGIGISDKFFMDLFSPFFQVKPSYLLGEKGTGLGMSISKSIVQIHGGEMWVVSSGKGKGTTIYFTLPREIK